MFYDLLTYELLTNIPQYPNGPNQMVNQQTSLEATTVNCKIKQNFSEGFQKMHFLLQIVITFQKEIKNYPDICVVGLVNITFNSCLTLPRSLKNKTSRRKHGVSFHQCTVNMLFYDIFVSVQFAKLNRHNTARLSIHTGKKSKSKKNI